MINFQLVNINIHICLINRVHIINSQLINIHNRLINFN